MSTSRKRVNASSSSSQTSRSSEKPTRDLRSSKGNSSFKHEKDVVNVQVVLRCRPLSDEEVKAKTAVAVSCNELKREVTVFQNMGTKQINKTFVFDKVFDSNCKQKDLYDQIVAPLVYEALEGYNCTIFAYGQTGTGKTYTMQGEGRKDGKGGIHMDAGVIPRAVQQVFAILEAQKADYSIKASFIELYNEEVTDLLAPDEGLKCSDARIKKPVALMEYGKGAVFVKGLQEEVVYTADEIFNILEKGTAKMCTAETVVNKQSNRSHSLFTVTIHIKECSSEGVELIKCGKLNLVDLAGSENIFRSGAKEGRAREAGEINKSLLTLGRVINALVENSGHVPYRDSKLTRLLRDSLGGKTKTCIIATVSPSINCLDETLCSLDYAHRAKNIKNRPEVNQKVIKSAMIKDLYTKIDRLKQELHVTREKNGIYIPHDHYQSEEAAKKEMAEKLERMELNLEFKDKQLMELQELYIYQQQLTDTLNDNLERVQKQLVESKQAFFDLEESCRQANDTVKEKDYLIYNVLGAEKALTDLAFELRADLETAASELSRLFAEIERKNKMENGNKALIQNFHTQLAQQLEILHSAVEVSVKQQQKQLKNIEINTDYFVSDKDKASEELRTQLKKLKDIYGSGIKSLLNLAGELDGSSQSTFNNISSESSKQSSTFKDLIKEVSDEANAVLNDFQSSLTSQEQSIASFLEQQHKRHAKTYKTTQTVSRNILNFCKMLSTYISRLTLLVEEDQKIDDQKLCALKKNYEEYADCEERQLLNMVAELLASSNARKKKLVQTAADDLRDSSTSRISKLQEEMSNIQNCTYSAQEECTGYVRKTERQYLEDTATMDIVKDKMDNGFMSCMKQARIVSERWNQAYESLFRQQRSNVDSFDSIIQVSTESSRKLCDHLSTVARSTLEEADTANNNSLSYIEYLLGLDHKACQNINSLTVPCQEDLKDMEIAHSQKIVEISEVSEKCLIKEYMVEDHSCSTTIRTLNLPSMASIEELRTPAFEELLNIFRGADYSVKQPNRNPEAAAAAAAATIKSLDSRYPLTATI
ncbi:kinesin-like protein KIN-5D [Heracleum sosnowskyi]|uniref:Kinesin-like protein KIN-5D n=1 Tax=Heracleum sosnowskyi TaxID=360622 RepID=A0AAD8IP07_9APIA|nr:kinesin-like protein KIN-5D [Heracleum sosnowskyi]